MDNLVILNVALTIFFVYLLFSVMVSAINEVIAKVLNRRGKLLEEALQTLFTSPQWNSALDGIMQSGFITSIREKAHRFPDNIPAKNFALALVELIRDPKKRASADASLRQMIIDCPVLTEDAEKTLLTLIDKAEGDTDKFIAHVEELYEGLMKRTTQWYKSNLQKIVFVLGLIVAFSLNIDTIDMIKTLSRNPALAKAGADMVAQTMSTMKMENGTIAITNGNSDTTFVVSVGEMDSSKAAAPAADSASAKKEQTGTVIKQDGSMKNMAVVVKDLNGTLQNTGLQFNWSSFSFSTADCAAIIYKLIGILITAAALSLGAPFWFQILNNLIALRNAGKKEEK